MGAVSGKAGRPKEALTIYVHVLDDLEAARAYCKVFDWFALHLCWFNCTNVNVYLKETVYYWLMVNQGELFQSIGNFG